MSKQSETLLKLIAEYPDLEILPMVSADCIGDGDGYWMSTWGYTVVDHYLCQDERVYLKEDDFDELVEKFIDENYDAEGYRKMHEDEFYPIAEEKVREYEWKKAIIVKIVPDDRR